MDRPPPILASWRPPVKELIGCVDEILEQYGALAADSRDRHAHQRAERRLLELVNEVLARIAGVLGGGAFEAEVEQVAAPHRLPPGRRNPSRDPFPER
ncbi:MAG: hypothetical protein U0556_04895 [Dehalococcoidia bacterium]